MPRRKRGFMDDGISDSSGGSDDENADDDDPYQRKRRRRSGDEDDDEDEGFGGGRKPAPRHDWAKAPAFVSSKPTGTKPQLDQSEVMNIPEVVVGRDSGSESSGDSAEEDDQGDAEADDADGVDDDDDDDDDDGQDTEPSRVPSPRVRDEDDEEEQRPRFGGLGLGASSSRPPTTFSGFTRSGIGASRPAAVSIPPTPSLAHSPSPAPPASNDAAIPSNLPSAFGRSSRPQRAFVRNGASPTPPPLKPNLSASENAHFRKIEGTFGARMLAKMGWETGTGLGAEGRGIVVPIETKSRPKNMGIAFKGFGERTEQSKAEARRRGEVVSDDEDEERKKKVTKGKEKADKRSDAWKKPKKIRTKVEHKTYEQIVAEVGEDVAGPSGLGVIIDATGATVSSS